MTPTVAWSHRANRDLREIYDFIGTSRRSPTAARRLIESIREKAEAYVRQPGMGTLYGDLEASSTYEPVRSFRVKSYLAFYRETPHGIHVLRVFHGRQDYPSFF